MKVFVDKRHHEYEANYRAPHLFKMLLEKPETYDPHCTPRLTCLLPAACPALITCDGCLLFVCCSFVCSRAPLVKYADSMHDSDYLNLYLDIEDYRKIASTYLVLSSDSDVCRRRRLPTDLSAVSVVWYIVWLPNSAGQHDGALKIYELYIAPGAECEINLPPSQKQEFKDICELKKIPSTAETFDALQTSVMENIKMTLLPGFLSQEAKKRDSTFKLKKALTDEDKKIPCCTTCLAEFGFMKPRVCVAFVLFLVAARCPITSRAAHFASFALLCYCVCAVGGCRITVVTVTKYFVIIVCPKNANSHHISKSRTMKCCPSATCVMVRSDRTNNRLDFRMRASHDRKEHSIWPQRLRRNRKRGSMRFDRRSS